MEPKFTLKNRLKLTVSILALPLGSIGYSTAAQAQVINDEIIVTATRRAESIQDIPINISAIGGEQIEQQGFGDISELAAFVPGLNIADQGGRDGNRIVVRGLNVEDIQNSFGQENGGGTVATYVGEIPLFVDLRLNDLQRVEVLLGPQGTLYGAGTMGGAIRYIPNKPDFDRQLFEVRAGAYSYSEGSGISTDTGFTFNAPVSDNFALRGSLDFQNDRGFIDYPFVVRQPGASEPDAFADASNFRPIKDANTEEILSGRLAARWQPSDRLDATFTYYFQEGEYGGRNTSSFRTANIPATFGSQLTLDSGKYEFGGRVEEPNERDSDLLALEIVADLGFAELTSATGLATVEENGQRDQTDLLISLDYYYETFPTFTGFTFEDEETEIFNQELRLVSTAESRLSWIIGAFYNKNKYNALSSEFTPGVIEFNGLPTPQFSGDLEYFEADRRELEEKSVFGEVAFDVTDAWDVTFGARYYDYSLETAGTTDFPIFGLFDGVTDFQPYPLADIENQLTLAPNQSEDGVLFKVNTSYEFGGGNTVYATFSQGYRVGVNNGGEVCVGDYLNDDGQALCLYTPGQELRDGGTAILDERGASADTVDNFELGAKTTWLDGALRLNGAIFFMKWDNPQVSTTSINAGTSITVNAESAETKGVELDAAWQVSDRFGLRGNFSYTDANLTADVPGLVRQINGQGNFTADFGYGFGTDPVNARDGDRLPGSPKTQFSVFGDYRHPLSSGDEVVFNAGYAWQGDVLTIVGGLGESYTLPSYGRANAAIGYEADNWSLIGFVDNLFNDFSESSAANTPLNNQLAPAFDGDANPANVRRFRTNVLPPRSIGARFKYRFQ
ncbi:TonB-dependent receptor [Litorimonas sp. RW-G-Af-16]|uniref:TonB-dependent receptor n=1 Tax=Litorimonas sp. RW-G-Af-16 TaxID=3241168 RepID=UPI00390C7C8D